MYRSLRLVGLVCFALCLPSVAQKATGVFVGMLLIRPGPWSQAPK